MTQLRRREFITTAISGAVAACARPHRTADPSGSATLAVRGGTIWTSAGQTTDAVACVGDRIVAIGERDVAARRGPDTRVIDLGGGMATPGLVDGHAHLVGLGQSLEIVDLRGARSVDEIVKRLRNQGPTDGWLLGRGWDQNLWEDPQMPTHAPLDAAFGDRPVWLRRVDGHAGWASAALLRTAGIGRETTPPAGGEILRNAQGEPTGVLIDAAMDLITPPASSRTDVRRWVLAGAAHAVERGLTGVHEMGIAADADAVYRELAATGELPLRVDAYAAAEWLTGGLQPHAVEPANASYRLVGVKFYADGALGSRGAALLEDYSDRPGHRGLIQYDAPTLRRIVGLAVAAGLQPATHAIGDAANRAVLDAYAEAMSAAERSALRPRIEHCQIVALADIPRFVELGVIASMQPTHATSDMEWVPPRIGPDRLAGAYAWQRFLAAGVPLVFGSDFPVEHADPRLGLAAAVSRQDTGAQPPGGWLPDQRLSLDQALHAFTRMPAYAARREDEVGVLAIGMLADITCFARPLDPDPASLRAAPIAATIVGGRVVFSAP